MKTTHSPKKSHEMASLFWCATHRLSINSFVKLLMRINFGGRHYGGDRPSVRPNDLPVCQGAFVVMGSGYRRWFDRVNRITHKNGAPAYKDIWTRRVASAYSRDATHRARIPPRPAKDIAKDGFGDVDYAETDRNTGRQ